MILRENFTVKDKTIIEPEGGWKDGCWYHVLVSFNSSNPVHRALFYAGYLYSDKPGSYNMLIHPSYDEKYTICDVHALEVIKEIGKLT